MIFSLGISYLIGPGLARLGLKPHDARQMKIALDCHLPRGASSHCRPLMCYTLWLLNLSPASRPHWKNSAITTRGSGCAPQSLHACRKAALASWMPGASTASSALGLPPHMGCHDCRRIPYIGCHVVDLAERVNSQGCSERAQIQQSKAQNEDLPNGLVRKDMTPCGCIASILLTRTS